MSMYRRAFGGFAAIALSVAVRPDDRTDAARGDVQFQYNVAARTFRGRDVAEMKAFLRSKLMRPREEIRSETSEQQPDSAAAVPATAARVLRSNSRAKIDTIALHEEEATVTTILNVTAIVATEQGPVRRDSRGALEDIWERTSAGWKLKESRTSPLEGIAKNCKANVAAICSACAAAALRQGAYPQSVDKLVGLPEGLSEVPTCPLDGKKYRLAVGVPRPGAITVSCPNAVAHSRVSLIESFSRSMAPP